VSHYGFFCSNHTRHSPARRHRRRQHDVGLGLPAQRIDISPIAQDPGGGAGRRTGTTIRGSAEEVARQHAVPRLHAPSRGQALEPVNRLTVALAVGVVHRARCDVELVAERQRAHPVRGGCVRLAVGLTRAQREHGFRHPVEHAQKRAGGALRGRACLVPNRALSRQIHRSATRTRLVKVRHACERAAPKPPHPWPLRRHRRRPGVRSQPRWWHRPAPNRFAARPAAKGWRNAAG
jgi:hypothetical protein